MLLDEVRLKEERLRDGVGEDVLESLGPLDHTDMPDLKARPEISPDAGAQDVSFCDVADAALRVREQLDARLRGQRGHLGFDRLPRACVGVLATIAAEGG